MVKDEETHDSRTQGCQVCAHQDLHSECHVSQGFEALHAELVVLVPRMEVAYKNLLILVEESVLAHHAQNCHGVDDIDLWN